MASNLIVMASTLIAMAFNLVAMAFTLVPMASNLIVMASNLLARHPVHRVHPGSSGSSSDLSVVVHKGLPNEALPVGGDGAEGPQQKALSKTRKSKQNEVEKANRAL